VRLTDIEAWTLQVVDRVKARQPVEDDRVELKAKWPADPQRAARRIAGHANAVAGDRILWIIGIDEKAGTVPGAESTEQGTWWKQVARCFDELAPDVQFVGVPTDGVTVVAVVVSAERVPLVVTNAGGGAPEKEVPWRAGTDVRSAKRSELIRLLAPAITLPELTVFGGWLTYSLTTQDPGARWYLHLDLYVDMPVGATVVVPDHAVDVDVRWPDWSLPLTGGLHGAWGRRLGVSRLLGGGTDSPPPTFVVRGESQIILDGPGPATVVAEADLAPHPTAPADEAVVDVRFTPTGSARSGTFDAALTPTTASNHETARWAVTVGGVIRLRDVGHADR
jgi:hypothetical protein